MPVLVLLAYGCGVEDPTFYAKTGSIRLVATPDLPAATIWHQGPDDFELQSVGVTAPATLDLLAPGSHIVALESPGYFTIPEFVLCEVTAGDICEAAFQLEPNLGSLAVNSIPDGAAILIDDADQGLVTPGTVVGLDPGDYVVSVALEGYVSVPTSRTVTIASDQVATADFTLEPTAPPAVKVVLLEGFSNVCCDGCPTMNENLHTFLGIDGYGPDRVLLVKWAVGYPLATDPHYTANQADNDARAWGPGYDMTGTYADLLAGVPSLIGDGGLLGVSGIPPDVPALQSLVDTMLDEEPGFSIQVDATVNGVSVAAIATLTASGPVDVADCSLNFVLVQNPIEYPDPACTFGDEEYVFHWVMRDFDSDALTGGQLVAGTPRIVSTTLGRDLGWPAADMYVIAFVQNDLTRKVIQAGSNIPVGAKTQSLTAFRQHSPSPLIRSGGQP